VDGSRRLSQAIAEGDGISVLVEVSDTAAAQAAQDQGAGGFVVRGHAGTIRESFALPVLAFGRADDLGGIDALVVDGSEDRDALAEVIAAVHDRGLECVLRVSDEDDLEEVLELVDPEIFLLTAEEADDGQPLLERLLELLADVPAGKLAIAELAGASRADVVELERAGVDAVIVSGSDIGSLVGDTLPDL
jgi:indole-3-glycerol phosphate synthase